MMRQAVQEVIDAIAPSLARDGGSITLTDVDEAAGIVKVKLSGACAHCTMAPAHLKFGIEEEIKTRVPSVRAVVAEGFDDEDDSVDPVATIADYDTPEPLA